MSSSSSIPGTRNNLDLKTNPQTPSLSKATLFSSTVKAADSQAFSAPVVYLDEDGIRQELYTFITSLNEKYIGKSTKSDLIELFVDVANCAIGLLKQNIVKTKQILLPYSTSTKVKEYIAQLNVIDKNLNRFLVEAPKKQNHISNKNTVDLGRITVEVDYHWCQRR